MERLPTWSWWLPLGASWGTNPKLMLGVVGVRERRHSQGVIILMLLAGDLIQN